ncbi:MAG: protein kinase [bacterium]|nr:protein kinase [bacterium]
MNFFSSGKPYARLQGRTLIVAQILWIGIAVIAVGLFAFSLPLHIAETATPTTAPDAQFYRLHPDDEIHLKQLGVDSLFYALYLNAFNLIFMVAFTASAVFIFYHSSDNLAALLVSLSILLCGVSYSTSLGTLISLGESWRLPVNLIKSAWWNVGVLCLFVFPTGRFTPRWLAVPALAWSLWMLLWPFFPQLDPFVWRERGSSLILIAFVAAVIAQLYRYRYISDVVQRQQTRISLYVLTFVLVISLSYNSFVNLIPQLQQPGLPRLLFNMVTIPPFIFAPMFAIPFGLAVAILREKLWDLHRFFSISLFLSMFTAVLSMLYFWLVLALQQVIILLTDLPLSPLALIAPTLLLGTLLPRLSRYVQQFVFRLLFATNQPQTIQYNQPTVEVRPVDYFRPGMTLGENYFLIREVHRSPMSIVYEGRHLFLNKPVAVKLLASQLTENPVFQKRFKQEARVVSHFNHERIVRVTDYVSTPGCAYMVMDFIKGPSLQQYLTFHGLLSLGEATLYAEDIASALDYAHERNVIHRDVKPGNILLWAKPEHSIPNREYVAMLTDFGIAKELNESLYLTEETGMGTPEYMSPEQIQSTANVDKRTDIYSLAIVVFQMITGRLPYSAQSHSDIITQHLYEDPLDPRLFRNDLPHAFAEAITRALSKNPAERFSSASEFVGILRKSLDDTPPNRPMG